VKELSGPVWLHCKKVQLQLKFSFCSGSLIGHISSVCIQECFRKNFSLKLCSECQVVLDEYWTSSIDTSTMDGNKLEYFEDSENEFLFI
jgi:hypothetical protein